MNLQNVQTRLESLLGKEGLPSLPNPLPTWWTAQPVATVAPASVAEVSAIVRIAEEEGIAVLPCGGGTQLQTGYPPPAERPSLLLSTSRMNRLMDYQPDDLTVTCEPGMTLEALQQTLGERHQFLALDVPLAEQATLGGIVSTNLTGFWRPAYGAPRDLLIGLKAIMTDSVEVKGGGRVVKNVAGYDVCKLFTGAWGTMGVLTELTFRIRTRPQEERVLTWEVPDVATAVCVGLKLHHARLYATFVLASNEPIGTPRLLLGLHGSPERVDWQASEFARQVREAGVTASPVVLPSTEVKALLDRQARLSPETTVAAKIATLPTTAADIAQRLQSLPQLSLTVPRVIARIVPLTQMAA